MTKPAIDINTFAHGVLYERFWINGVLQTEDYIVIRSKHIVDQKPESTNNPLRPDGTRGPSGWTRYGGVANGVTGTYTKETLVPPDRYVRQWQGQLAAPGLNPGNIAALYEDGELQAIRQALGRLGEAEVQLGAAMREARQTSEMVGKYYRHAVTLTGKLESAVRGSKRVRQQFKDFLKNGWKDVPSAYLEYLFGMKPLADDLTNAVQVLHDNKQHGGAFNMTLRGRFKGSASSHEPAYQSWVSPLTQCLGDVGVTQLSRASLTFQLPDWYWDRLPPVTFFRESWETTGLSFVLDWVLPINSWLAGFEGNQLRPFFREGSRSTLLRRQLSGADWPEDFVQVDSAAGGRDYLYTRSAMHAFPTEELFTLPRFRNILGLDQLRVGSALFGQRLASLARAIARQHQTERIGQMSIILNSVTYNWSGFDQSGTSRWTATAAGVASAFSNLTARVTVAQVPQAKSAQSASKVKWRIQIPVVATEDSSCSCVGTVLRTAYTEITSDLAVTATAAERADLLARIQSLVLTPEFAASINNLTQPAG